VIALVELGTFGEVAGTADVHMGASATNRGAEVPLLSNDLSFEKVDSSITCIGVSVLAH
jgi:hypothetical protein